MSPSGLLLHIGPRNLPPALTLSLYAAANVVIISFVPAALFTGDRQRGSAAAYPRLAVPWLAAAGRSPAVRVAAGALGVAALAAAAADGGDRLWVGFWVGAVLACALVGNLWKLLNPWAALADLLTAGRPRPAPLRLPAWLGAWPAVAGYLGFAVVALAPPSGPPWLTAALVAGYTALTLAGTILFGRDEWLGRCEGLTVLLDLAGRFGPAEAERDAAGRVERVWLRPWGSGLLRPGATGWDRVAFVMVVLSTLAFDGLRTGGGLPATPFGATLNAAAGSLLLAAAFLLVFAALVRGMRLLAGAGAGDAAAVTTFALTLVPIGLLYAAAHFSSALFGPPEAGPVLTGADTIWFVQVTAVLAGHAIAVHLAHRHAGQRFRSARRAVLSQYPVLVALVLYTMTSLWILAQPLTNG